MSELSSQHELLVSAFFSFFFKELGPFGVDVYPKVIKVFQVKNAPLKKMPHSTLSLVHHRCQVKSAFNFRRSAIEIHMYMMQEHFDKQSK